MNILPRIHRPLAGFSMPPAQSVRNGMQLPHRLAAAPSAARTPGPSMTAPLQPRVALSTRASTIAFDDPQAYERMTGDWSRRVGERFLAWVAPQPGQRWLDVGCGTGAFTRLIAERCAPVSIDALDPEPAQLEFARQRGDAAGARFHRGEAGEIPFPGNSFDISVMALVLAYLPDPARGVAEMVRVLSPGGVACAYNWDLAAARAPLSPLIRAMRQSGLGVKDAPSQPCAGEAALRRLWEAAGLQAVQCCRIEVQRRYESLEEVWAISMRRMTAAQPGLSGLTEAKRAEVKALFAELVQPDADGGVLLTATAVGVWGTVPR